MLTPHRSSLLCSLLCALPFTIGCGGGDDPEPADTSGDNASADSPFNFDAMLEDPLLSTPDESLAAGNRTDSENASGLPDTNPLVDNSPIAPVIPEPQFIVPLDEASRILGQPVLFALVTHTETPQGFVLTSTQYYRNISTKLATISVVEPVDLDQWYTAVTDKRNATPVQGLGDAAVAFGRTDGHITARTGEYGLDLWGSSPSDFGKIERLGKLAIVGLQAGLGREVPPGMKEAAKAAVGPGLADLIQ